MSIVNFPFSGTSPGNAGPYSAELFRLYIETLFTGLNRANAGVLLLSGDGSNEPLNVVQTAPASAQVKIHPGAALVNGCWFYSDSDETLAIAANTDPSGFARIDLVILRFNATAQTVTIVDLQGTPAGAPVAPTLTQTATQYEIPLAQIAVANLFTTIVTANINNNVRTFARLAQINEGGTGRGYNDYTNRESLIGISGAGAWELLTGCTVERTSAGAALAADSWQTMECAEATDPDGLISVTTNRITFAKAGYYHVNCTISFTNGANANAHLVRLRNITTGTTLVIGTAHLVAGGAIIRSWSCLNGYFTIAANDQLELQVYGIATTTTLQTDGAIGAETARALQARFIRYTAS